MRKAEHYRGPVVKVAPDAPVAEVADRMDEFAVGCVVVCDDAGGPLGIVTDRDLLRRVVAPGQDPEKLQARDVMSGDLLTGRSSEPLEQILDRMRQRGVRRLPILGDSRLVGLVTLDDVVAELGRELRDVREAVRGEVLGSRRVAGRRRFREQFEDLFESLRVEANDFEQQTRKWVQQEIESLRARLRGGL